MDFVVHVTSTRTIGATVVGHKMTIHQSISANGPGIPAGVQIHFLFLPVSFCDFKEILETSYTNIGSHPKVEVLKMGGDDQAKLLADVKLVTQSSVRMDVKFDSKNGQANGCTLYAGIQYVNSKTKEEMIYWLAPIK